MTASFALAVAQGGFNSGRGKRPEQPGFWHGMPGATSTSLEGNVQKKETQT